MHSDRKEIDMTQKDYIKIAADLAGAYAMDKTGAIWCLTLSLADTFAQDNPRFDRSKFYAAVMGTSDHFAARDKIFTESQAN
jgi:hypothetical protein